ncbi:MAG: hypothetical protein IPM13_08080 [Phycisphaerales bacterium]|nr:hypothetical protein [Phycisphaerales bacterium]
MSPRIAVISSLILSALLPAIAENQIREWGGAPVQDYNIYQEEQEIEILAPGVYKFQALEFQAGTASGLGVIDRISFPFPIAGDVEITVARDPNEVANPSDPNQHYGVRLFKYMPATANAAVTLREFRVSEDVAGIGPVVADLCGGAVHIGGDILDDFEAGGLRGDFRCRLVRERLRLTGVETVAVRIDGLAAFGGSGDQVYIEGLSGGTLSIGDMAPTSSVRVVGSPANVEFAQTNGSPGTMYGKLTVQGDVGAISVARSILSFSGQVHILEGNLGIFYSAQSFLGELHVEGNLLGFSHAGDDSDAMAGSIYVGGDLTGSVLLQGADRPQVRTDIDIQGDLKAQVTTMGLGALHVGGDFIGSIVDYSDYVIDRPIEIDGDMIGGFESWGYLCTVGPCSGAGLIRIKGGFGATAHILLGYRVYNTGWLCIDWDGYDPGDRWENGAFVRFRFEGETITGNRPDLRIYEVTRCKGDMDNDGDVDFDDIDPFVAALEPGTTYDQTWFGLSGSRVFHGDFTGDGYVTFDDLDPFVARLGYCSPDGGYLEEEGGGEGEGDGDGDGGMMMNAGGPEDQAAALAAQLRASVSAERMDTLIDAVTALAANPPDGSTIPWDLVLVELGQ